MGKFQNFLIEAAFFIVGSALVFFGGGYIGYLIKGEPKATPHEIEEWIIIRHELGCYSSFKQLEYESKVYKDLFPPVDPEEQQHFLERFDRWINGKETLEDIKERQKESIAQDIKRLDYRQARKGGYGQVGSDWTIPYDEWIKDPMGHRIRCMSFWDKVLYGWGKHKYFRK